MKKSGTKKTARKGLVRRDRRTNRPINLMTSMSEPYAIIVKLEEVDIPMDEINIPMDEFDIPMDEDMNGINEVIKHEPQEEAQDSLALEPNPPQETQQQPKIEVSGESEPDPPRQTQQQPKTEISELLDLNPFSPATAGPTTLNSQVARQKRVAKPKRMAKHCQGIEPKRVVKSHEAANRNRTQAVIQSVGPPAAAGASTLFSDDKLMIIDPPATTVATSGFSRRVQPVPRPATTLSRAQYNRRATAGPSTLADDDEVVIVDPPTTTVTTSRLNRVFEPIPTPARTGPTTNRDRRKVEALKTKAKIKARVRSLGNNFLLKVKNEIDHLRGRKVGLWHRNVEHAPLSFYLLQELFQDD